MTKRTRRTHSAEFKAKVALAAVKGAEPGGSDAGSSIIRDVACD